MTENSSLNALTEEQFHIIKALCSNHIYVACVPDVLPEDPASYLVNHQHHMEVFLALKSHGFVEDITAKFTETIKERIKEQEELLGLNPEDAPIFRGFHAFAVTELGLNMFDAPEGLVN